MGGKRSDKDTAWKSIENFLREEGLWEDTPLAHGLVLTEADQKRLVTRSLDKLRRSGRLDARQVWIVKQIIKELVWLLRSPLRRQSCATLWGSFPLGENPGISEGGE